MSTITVSNVTPATGTTITKQQVVKCDVTCSGATLDQLVLAFNYSGLSLYEVAYDGGLTSHYAPTSLISTTAGGFHFEFLRTPVWPDSPHLKVFAAATDGTVLATELDWTLLAGQAVIPGPTPEIVPVVYPVTGSAVCDATMYDEVHFLDLFDRVFPEDYLAPLKLFPNSGYELFEGAGAMGARISQAVERLECDSFVLSAQGGVKASGTVQFFRPNASSGSVTIKAGSIVTTSEGNRDFVTQQDVSFTASDVGPFNVLVLAIATGYEWNVRGQVITPAGLVIPGAIDTCRLLYEDPPYGDATIQVQQLLDTTGGRPPALDGLGHDRSIERFYNESDSHYGLRIRSLPDTISPDAIQRNLQQYLPPLGITWSTVEEWDIRYQTCWDAPSTAISANPNFNPNLFYYDESVHLAGPFHDRWLDEVEMDGAFIVVVSFHNPIYDVSIAYDDPGVQPTDFKNALTGWQRGTSAFDTNTVSTSAPVYPGCYDGFDLGGAAAMIGLWNLLQSVKAAGVAAIIEENGQ